jgi:hypothetical protein
MSLPFETVEYIAELGADKVRLQNEVDEAEARLNKKLGLTEPEIQVHDAESLIVLIQEGVERKYPQRLFVNYMDVHLEWNTGEFGRICHSFEMTRSSVFRNIAFNELVDKSVHGLYLTLIRTYRAFVPPAVIATFKSVTSTKKSTTERDTSGMRREYVDELTADGKSLPEIITFNNVPVFDGDYIEPQGDGICTLECAVIHNDDATLSLSANAAQISEIEKKAKAWLLEPVYKACEEAGIRVYQGFIE